MCKIVALWGCRASWHRDQHQGAQGGPRRRGLPRRARRQVLRWGPRPRRRRPGRRGNPLFLLRRDPDDRRDERSVEMAFVREEYRRAHGGDIGELIYPGRVLEQFVECLERAVDREKTSGATIVVDFCGGVAGLVASRVFSRLGVSAVVMEGFANANTVGEAGRTDLEETIERVARIVPTVDAAFGAVVGPEAEYVQFVDDKGE